ncbi:unnamed protein product, partial [Ectocarpus sp. 13 AM-2016]
MAWVCVCWGRSQERVHVVLCQKAAFAKSLFRSDGYGLPSGNQATHFLASSNGGVDKAKSVSLLLSTELESFLRSTVRAVRKGDRCSSAAVLLQQKKEPNHEQTMNNLPAHTGFHAYHKTVVCSG